MSDIESIRGFDFPETVQIREGYDYTDEPTFCLANFIFLVEKVNELVEEINVLKSEADA